MTGRIYSTARWRRLRPYILNRDNGCCHWCGRRAWEVDHLVSPLEGGSRYDPANLVASCGPCNARRGGELSQSRARRRLAELPVPGVGQVTRGASGWIRRFDEMASQEGVHDDTEYDCRDVSRWPLRVPAYAVALALLWQFVSPAVWGARGCYTD